MLPKRQFVQQRSQMLFVAVFGVIVVVVVVIVVVNSISSITRTAAVASFLFC